MATTPAPSAIHSSTALLGHLARISQAHSEASLEQVGLRPRQLVTLTLLRDAGPSTQQSLATALAIDRTNLVGLLNELETAGLLRRRRSEQDRRRHIVELTEAGAAKLGEAERALARAEAELLHGLDEQERQTLYELLQRATAGHVVDCGEAVRDRTAACAEDDAAC